jgi:hypothetical protein
MTSREVWVQLEQVRTKKVALAKVLKKAQRDLRELEKLAEGLHFKALYLEWIEAGSAPEVAHFQAAYGRRPPAAQK